MEFDRSHSQAHGQQQPFGCEESDAATDFGLAACEKLVAPNIPENNQLKMLDYRNRKVAAFTVNGRTLICLPQAFEFFLKNLVGGLHTVYTKLKRLEVTPVVCNVEQVRVLRSVAAIQPGVNRCKLIAPSEFDTLFDDCTNSTARPGRPPKRQFQSSHSGLFLPPTASNGGVGVGVSSAAHVAANSAAYSLLPHASDALASLLHQTPVPAAASTPTQRKDGASPWSISHILAPPPAPAHSPLELLALANYLQFPYANAAVQQFAALANAANNNASQGRYASCIRQITSTIESLLAAAPATDSALPPPSPLKCPAPQSPKPDDHPASPSPPAQPSEPERPQQTSTPDDAGSSRRHLQQARPLRTPAVASFSRRHCATMRLTQSALLLDWTLCFLLLLLKCAVCVCRRSWPCGNSEVARESSSAHFAISKFLCK